MAKVARPTRRLDPTVPEAPRIAIVVKPDQLVRLDELAERWQISRSAVIRRLVDQGLTAVDEPAPSQEDLAEAS